MYEFLIGLQVAVTVAILLSLIRLCRLNSFASTRFLLLTGAALSIYSAGYLFEMLSKDEGEVLQALRMEYLGIPFLALCFYVFVSQYSDIHIIPKFLIYILMGFNIFCGICMIDCKNTGLYYSSFTFVDSGIFPHIETGKGILYMIFAIEEAVLLILCAVIFFWYYRRKARRKERLLYFAMFLEALIPITGVLLNLFPVLPNYDFLPLMLGVMYSVLVLTLTNGRLYDVESVAVNNLYSELSSGIIITNTDGEYVDANKRAYEIFSELSTLKSGEHISFLHEDFLKNSEDLYFDRNNVYYSAKSSKLYEKERHIGYIISITDVTEMRKRIDEMERLKDQADSANKAKSTFLANMSHEIRTPLNAIIGMATLCRNEDRKDVLTDYIQQIENSGKLLVDIVTEVLDFSKAESGKLELNPVEYDIAEVLNSVITMTNMRIGDKPISFLVNIDPSTPGKLIGDDVRLKQILMNFLSNAEKNTERGKIALYCESEITGDTVELRFRVEDTGCGIKEENLGLLFKPFSQVDTGINRRIVGTGLGLSIAAQIIELNDGSYDVKSSYGEGSVFYFSVKQKIKDPTPLAGFEERGDITVAKYTPFYLYGIKQDTESSSKEDASKPRPSYKDARVLVVDDNKVNVKVLCAFLKKYDIIADKVYSGSDAVKITGEKKYDLIFMDHMMPEMDGVDTTKAIREDSDNPNKATVIVACTANVIKGIEDEFKKIGMNGFIAKPIQTDALEVILNRYLG